MAAHGGAPRRPLDEVRDEVRGQPEVRALDRM